MLRRTATSVGLLAIVQLSLGAAETEKAKRSVGSIAMNAMEYSREQFDSKFKYGLNGYAAPRVVTASSQRNFVMKHFVNRRGFDKAWAEYFSKILADADNRALRFEVKDSKSSTNYTVVALPFPGGLERPKGLEQISGAIVHTLPQGIGIEVGTTGKLDFTPECHCDIVPRKASGCSACPSSQDALSLSTDYRPLLRLTRPIDDMRPDSILKINWTGEARKR